MENYLWKSIATLTRQCFHVTKKKISLLASLPNGTGFRHDSGPPPYPRNATRAQLSYLFFVRDFPPKTINAVIMTDVCAIFVVTSGDEQRKRSHGARRFYEKSSNVAR